MSKTLIPLHEYRDFYGIGQKIVPFKLRSKSSFMLWCVFKFRWVDQSILANNGWSKSQPIAYKQLSRPQWFI